jgi:hypothetical protein
MSLLKKLASRSERPTFRVRGFGSRRTLIAHFPAAPGADLVLLPVDALRDHSLKIERADKSDKSDKSDNAAKGDADAALSPQFRVVAVPCGQGAARHIVVLSSKEQAEDVIRRMREALAPSRWALVAKVAALVLLVTILTPSDRTLEQTAPKAPKARYGSANPPVGFGAAPTQPLQAQQGAAIAQPPIPPQPPERNAAPDRSDPFGLRVN